MRQPTIVHRARIAFIAFALVAGLLLSLDALARYAALPEARAVLRPATNR